MASFSQRPPKTPVSLALAIAPIAAWWAVFTERRQRPEPPVIDESQARTQRINRSEELTCVGLAKGSVRKRD